ncbi:Hint domain-containing protein [Seohaeicola saemankumensis]|nr:Hint domain-containing protein [Seohaeicola saemankumensis]MCA0870134.1 Hint domain-containing protein [Seohaeicola saemankumensis]
MATWDYLSIIEYERTGQSFNFKNSGNFVDYSGTLDDGQSAPTLGYDTFEDGDTFDITTPMPSTVTLVNIPQASSVTLTYVGTYVTDVATYVILGLPGNPDIGFFFGQVDSTTANDDLPNIVNENDPEFDNGEFTPCFVQGTLIATPCGDRKVETLKTGDLILNAVGVPIRVKWVGRKTILPLFRPAERLMPVRFAAGSLGDGLPHADLTVTADHAMLVDGVLCNAGALVNGSSIMRVPLAEMGERFTVYHIETEAHEIILANGAPAETFIDNVSRRVFDNFAEFEAMYGDVPEMEELPLPRAMSARQVPAGVRRKTVSRGRLA